MRVWGLVDSALRARVPAYGNFFEGFAAREGSYLKTADAHGVRYLREMPRQPMERRLPASAARQKVTFSEVLPRR